ncbi:non-hydrolyzing UDP-N-acetylglucosamine 2-epimerase [uncultured Methanoregula sp.]|uniref:non-hydrolyzing UDP-N-acetylglucosamine 2-epimerase n=1 Tax=uncultured Methanoregula sp. TaxID=1005933 RepID=UPI002AABFCD7|nr:UDP-N-acetylglucosamine 2-epimerase (non-hydrolyzing) [uncultured Methanoregula sp.]
MTEKSLKVMTILGTRPEIIRLSRIISLLDEYTRHILVHTGQNYDYELNEVFFKDLNLRKPDYFLNVNTTTLGNVYGDTIIKSEKIMVEEKPDALLILGDTNSAIAAIIAKRLRIPIFHMEAGNRGFDLNVPEEINRKIIDHISDFNLAYNDHARRHLLAEGLPHRRIYLTGSPLYEVLVNNREKIDASTILRRNKLKSKNYFVMSIHREENVDNPVHLEKICHIINQIAEKYNKPVIISTHPRTRKRLDSFAKKIKFHPQVKFFKPFGFFDYVKLQKNALCTISDSGTISEESAILSFPAITIRNSIERPEALDAGTILLTGLDADTVLDSIELVMEEHKLGIEKKIPAEYQIADTSWRVVKLIIGTAKLSNQWSGINPK